MQAQEMPIESSVNLRESYGSREWGVWRRGEVRYDVDWQGGEGQVGGIDKDVAVVDFEDGCGNGAIYN